MKLKNTLKNITRKHSNGTYVISAIICFLLFNILMLAYEYENRNIIQNDRGRIENGESLYSLTIASDVIGTANEYNITGNKYEMTGDDPFLEYSFPSERKVAKVFVTFSEGIKDTTAMQVYYRHADEIYNQDKCESQIIYPGTCGVILDIEDGAYSGIRIDINGDFSLDNVYVTDAQNLYISHVNLPIVEVCFLAVSFFLTLVYKFIRKKYQKNLQNGKIWKIVVAGFAFLFIYGIGVAGGIGQFKLFTALTFLTITSVYMLLVNKMQISIEKSVFFLILILGTASTFFQPVFDTYDEVAHFARAELLSRGNIILDRQLDMEYSSYETIKTFADLCKGALNKTINEITMWHTSINYEKINVGNVQTLHMSIFYIPQAIGILVAKILRLPAIWMVFCGRICNLIFYAFLSSKAVKLAGKYYRIIMILTILPFSIIQAASFSPDAMTYGILFMFLAYFIHLYSSRNELNIRSIANIIILSVLVVFSKFTNVVFLGLLFLLVNRCIQDKRKKKKFIVLICAVGLISAGISVIDSLMYASPIEYLNYYAESNVNATEQIRYMLSHLPSVVINGLAYLITQCDTLITQLNSMGWQRIYQVPLLSFMIFLAMFRSVIDTPAFLEEKWSRIWSLFLAFLTHVACGVTLYVSWTKVGADYITILQARYVLPALVLVMMAFAGKYTRVQKIEGNSTAMDLYDGILLYGMTFMAVICV